MAYAGIALVLYREQAKSKLPLNTPTGLAWEIGEVVISHSDASVYPAHKMCISAIDLARREPVRCQWFDKDSILHEKWFKFEQLEKVST